jgi:hypothetical protein
MLNKTGVKGVFFYDSFRILKHMELLNKLCPELETCLPGELTSKVFPNLKHLFVLNIILITITVNCISIILTIKYNLNNIIIFLFILILNLGVIKYFDKFRNIKKS